MRRICLILSLVLILIGGLAPAGGSLTQVHAQGGTFIPTAVTDQTPTVPLDNPTPSSYQPRYVSGFGSDDSFTVFFEDRDVNSTISYASTTSGPTGFPGSATATNISDTHFVVKDWPITVGSTEYSYRAWASVGNHENHKFYVSDDLSTWTQVSTFTISNDSNWNGHRGSVYYGFHDVVQLNGTYYAFAESNQGQTMLVRSANGDDDWEAFASVGGTQTSDGPLQLPESGTPSGSFVSLGYDRGYGKVHVRGDDSGFYLAVNTAAKPSLGSTALEEAFIDPANWTWHDGTTGLPATPILTATTEHDLRECWVVPNTDPDADWVIVYTADYGEGKGGKALGYATLTPPAGPPVHNVTQGTYYNTIQDAIDAADPGNTIEVAAGTYEEDLEIDKADLTLQSVTKHEAVIRTEGAFNAGNGYGGVTVLANGITIDGFKIQQSVAHAIIHTHDSEDVVISNNRIEGVDGARPRGIDVGYASANSDGVRVEGNEFLHLYCGVYVNQGNDLLVDANEFDDMTGAAVVFDGTWGNTDGSIVTNNTATDANYLLRFFNEVGPVTAPLAPDADGNTLVNTDYSNYPVVNTTKNTYYGTIQSAIDDAAPNNTIEAAAGTYAENVVILADLDGLALIGAVDDGGNPTSIIAPPADGPGVQADDSQGLLIENFEITGATTGDGRGWGVVATATEDVILKNLYSHHNASDGIRVRTTNNATVRDCVSVNNDGDGITFYSFGTILDNVVGDNDERGIYIHGGSAVGTGSLTISGNHVYNNQNDFSSSDQRVGGIIVYSAAHAPAVLSVEIEDNVVHDNVGPGILLYKVNSQHEDESASNPAVPVSPDNLSSVNGNTIYGNKKRTGEGFGDGILVYMSHYVTIEGNEIYGNEEAGIRITNDYKYDSFGPTTNNSILLNNIYGNPYAVLIQGGTNYQVTDTTVKHNQLLNQEYGLANLANGDVIVDATYNWWGDTTGPYHESKNSGGQGSTVSDNVDFDPWHEAPAEMKLDVPEEPAWLATCEDDEITVDVLLRANGFNGVEFQLTYPEDMLEVTDVSLGSMWDGYDEGELFKQDLSTDGKVWLAVSLLEADTILNVIDAQVAQITFKAGTESGTAQLNFDNVLVSTPDGVPIDVELTGDALEVKGCGCVAGTVELQGRFESDWVTPRWQNALVTLSGGPGGEYTATSDSDGYWQICGVVEGDYEVLAVKTLYLTAERSDPVTVQDAGNAEAGSVKLLGGDMNNLTGDPRLGNNEVDAGDASVLAYTFGLSSTDAGYDDDGDINDDNVVNILDASILGGNYGKVGPIGW